MRTLIRATAGSALLLFGCQQQPEPVKKPKPPDMSAVIASYRAPTAPLDPTTAQMLWDAAHSTVDVLNLVGLDQSLLDAVQAAADEHLNMQATQAQGGDEPIGQIREREILGDGYLRVTRICNGWGVEPVPDKEANGYIVLTAGFTETGFDPVMWGGFLNCKYRLGDQLIELKGTQENSYGTFSGYLGENVPFAMTGQVSMLYQFDVLATVDDQAYTLAADFRVDPSALEFEFKVPVEGGYLLAVANRELVGVRATNGDFGCSEATRTCTNGSETVPF